MTHESLRCTRPRGSSGGYAKNTSVFLGRSAQSSESISAFYVLRKNPTQPVSYDTSTVFPDRGLVRIQSADAVKTTTRIRIVVKFNEWSSERNAATREVGIPRSSER
jgi:hypothetical protein